MLRKRFYHFASLLIWAAILSIGVAQQPPVAAPAALSLADLIEKTEPSCVRIDVTTRDGQGIGSGFVVHSGDWVATNHHVVAGARTAEVSFSDGTKAKVEGYLAFDKQRDVAILKMKLDKKRQPLSLASKRPRKGESAIAIGAPQGLSFTATEGIISAIREGTELKAFGHEAEGTWLQTSTPISPGSSGGPLLNGIGEVLGANSGSLATAQNVNFAISAEDIAKVIDEAMKNAKKDGPQALTKIDPRPSVRPTRPANPSLPGGSSPEPTESITVKLPAERKFSHKYKIAKEEDEFDKVTWLRTMWIPLKHNDPRLKSCGLRVGVPYKEDTASPAVVWELGVTAKSFVFLGQGAGRFQLLVDGESVEVSNPTHKGDILPNFGGTSERMTSLFHLDGFLKVAMAKEVKARLGALEYTLSREELECLRDLASQLPTGTTSDGERLVNVERYAVEDDPSVPPSMAKAARAKAAREAEKKAAAVKTDEEKTSEAKPVSTSAATDSEYRVWTTADGKFKVEAKLIRVQDGKALLQRRDDGRQITVPQSLLSKSDRDFLTMRPDK